MEAVLRWSDGSALYQAPTAGPGWTVRYPLAAPARLLLQPCENCQVTLGTVLYLAHYLWAKIRKDFRWFRSGAGDG